jgi:acetyltransferase-like isoleucine patch superfamily enzyme
MRRIAKNLLTLAGAVLTLPLSLLALVFGESAFMNGGTIVGALPFGNFLRVGYYRMTLAAMSPEVSIAWGSYFSKRSARVGRQVRIGAYCIIGNATIEDDVNIASKVSITSGRHQHGSGDGRLAGSTVVERVVIGKGSWIGEGAIVCASVGSGCIVGAGAVVVRPVPDGDTVGGNPARSLRTATPS